ncbi:bifunctional 3-demethylubiquinone-9 3-methyltransferase/ 2-octaprenyl-6-hydroxy phenol methylase [compost metagenome]
MSDTKVINNQYGFFELLNQPTDIELENYYKDIYYQESKGSYSKSYEVDEIEYFNNKYEQKYSILVEHNILSCDTREFLDIGCGEGWGLNFFYSKGWNVTGVEHSSYGCSIHNEGMLPFLSEGEPEDFIKKLIAENKKFDVIWLDNVLEHLRNPLEMLMYCSRLLSDHGILAIEVPNDFSVVQKRLLEKGCINGEFWVLIPDHLSYFNKDGLINLCSAAGLKYVDIISDYAIDFDLFNPCSNYKANPSVGPNSHKSRIEIENMLHSISVEKTNKLYRVYAELGIGRQITGFFKNNKLS